MKQCIICIVIFIMHCEQFKFVEADPYHDLKFVSPDAAIVFDMECEPEDTQIDVYGPEGVTDIEAFEEDPSIAWDYENPINFTFGN